MIYDPRGPVAVAMDNDITKRYLEHYHKCLETKLHFGDRLDELGIKGYEVVDVFHTDAHYNAFRSYGTNEVHIRDMGPEIVRALFTDIFSTSLSDKISTYFMCPWMPLFFSVFASVEKTASLKWHCDNGPNPHLKLLVYLNDTDGRTDFVDRFTTDLFKRWGYGFCPTRSRVDDLHDLETGLIFDIDEVSPEAGQGILFDPVACLHKGVYPESGLRWVMQIGLIPWPEPWNKAFDTHYDVLERNYGAGFPILT